MRNVRRDSKRAEERECLHWGQPPQDRAPAVVEMSLQIPLLLKCTPVLEAVICCHHLEILMLCHRLPSFILQYSLQNLPAAPRRHEIPTSHLLTQPHPTIPTIGRSGTVAVYNPWLRTSVNKREAGPCQTDKLQPMRMSLQP